ncbi:MAG: AAA family ATPase [Patescibacteria group bacterium]|nr:AAA family ATPase [Patescibacteria group bacterium]
MSKSLTDRFSWSIIGHSKVVNFLQHSLVNSQVAQAYLFVGQNQVGKSTVARNFVDSLVCQNVDKSVMPIPCLQCESCRQAVKRIHPDIYWVGLELNEKTGKLKKNISVEQIRKLQNKLSLHSFLDTYKVVVIENADLLSLEGANSLLKTLEEPTAKTVLILLCTNISLVPSTIVSRCQILRFLPVSNSEIYRALLKRKVEDKKAKAIAAVAYGLPGASLSLVENSNDYLEIKNEGLNFLTLLKADVSQRLKLLDGMFDFSNQHQMRKVLSNWKKILRDIFLINSNCEMLIGNAALYSELVNASDKLKNEKIISDLTNIDSSLQYLNENLNSRLVIENLVLNF